MPLYFGLLWLVIVSTDCNLFNAWYLSLFAALLPLFLPLCFNFLNLCMWLMWSPSALINWTLSLLRSQAFYSLKVLLLLLAFILFGKCFMLRSCCCLNLNCSNSGGSGTQWWHSGQTILHARETAVHPQEVQWGGEISGLGQDKKIDTKNCRDREIDRHAIIALTSWFSSKWCHVITAKSVTNLFVLLITDYCVFCVVIFCILSFIRLDTIFSSVLFEYLIMWYWITLNAFSW